MYNLRSFKKYIHPRSQNLIKMQNISIPQKVPCVPSLKFISMYQFGICSDLYFVSNYFCSLCIYCVHSWWCMYQQFTIFITEYYSITRIFLPIDLLILTYINTMLSQLGQLLMSLKLGIIRSPTLCFLIIIFIFLLEVLCVSIKILKSMCLFKSHQVF